MVSSENYEKTLGYTNTKNFKCLNHTPIKYWSICKICELEFTNLYSPTTHPGEDLKLYCL
jgi:hypothetical protein